MSEPSEANATQTTLPEPQRQETIKERMEDENPHAQLVASLRAQNTELFSQVYLAYPIMRIGAFVLKRIQTRSLH